jgi:N-methylhydantoinase B
MVQAHTGASLPSDAVFLEILRNRFQGIVDEMGSVVLRTAHSAYIKETGDFGTALASPSGELFAAPLNYGVCILAGLPTATAIARSGANVQPGEVFIANDPYSTGGMSTHLNDIFLWKPIFVDDVLVCYGWSFIHSTDVGGGVPGSISYAHREIFQEGLIIPPTRIATRDGWDERVLPLILANSRIPELNRGDLNALLSALSVGERHVQDLARRYGVVALQRGIEGVLAYAARQAAELIRAIPDGTYHFSDYMDEERRHGVPVRLSLAITIDGDRALLDYSGTDPQAISAINMPTQGHNGHNFLVRGLVNYLRSQNPDAVPYQSGLVRQIDTHVEAGSLLFPSPGAPCGVRAATNVRLMETILGALAQAVPDKIPAAGAGQAAVFLVAVPDEARPGSLRVSVVEPLCGGSGGRPTKDGVDGTDSLTGGLRNIPIETLEAEMPVLIEQYALREGSAGAGRFRGGHGVNIAVRLLAPQATVTARNIDRYRFRPWGRDGGDPGSLGDAWLVHADGQRQQVGRPDVLHMIHDDVLILSSQGGGGFGDPLTRDPERVAQDVRNELLDAAAARSDYAVVLADGDVDSTATASLRSSRQIGSPAAPARFNFGPERQAHDDQVPATLREALLRVVLPMPPGERQHIWTGAMRRIFDRAQAGVRTTEDELPALLREVAH